MAWKLAQCAWREKAQLEAYLREGWEPFAVSETDAEPTIWLRRSTAPADAGIVEPPNGGTVEPPRGHAWNRKWATIESECRLGGMGDGLLRERIDRVL